jgi:Na+/H+ antiporter NhaD/arsenite permease-like protein
MRLAIVGAVLLLAAAAVVLSAVFAVRRPRALKASLIPWSLALGVDADPLVTPWESLATLLWHDRLLRMNVLIMWRGYALFGLIVAPLTVLAAVAALAATQP